MKNMMMKDQTGSSDKNTTRFVKGKRCPLPSRQAFAPGMTTLNATVL